MDLFSEYVNGTNFHLYTITSRGPLALHID